MTIRWNPAALPLALGALALLATPAGAQENYYEGRDVEFLVPFSAGGGNDAFSRFLQAYFQRCLPGVGSVQTVNVPGGGTVSGANEFELMREADGTTVLVTSSTTTFAWLMGQEGVQFSPRNWVPIMGVPNGGVIYVDPSTGVKSPADLASTDAELVFGGISPVGLDLLALLSFEVIGADPQVVMGYEGKGDVRLAFQQGELNLDYSTTDSFVASVQPLVDEGRALPLYTLGLVEDGKLVRDPALPDLPTVEEAYESIHGEPPSGTLWDAYLALVTAGVSANRQVWVMNTVPPEGIAALKEAAACAVADPEFMAAGTDLLAGYTPVIGAPLEANADRIFNVSDEVVQWLRHHVAEKYGVEISD